MQYYLHLQQNQPKDPALEHIDAMGAKPFQAFPGQDHRAHVTAHLSFMASNFVRNNPSITASLEKNILEHISIMAQEQVQLEFLTRNANVTTNATSCRSEPSS